MLAVVEFTEQFLMVNSPNIRFMLSPTITAACVKMYVTSLITICQTVLPLSHLPLTGHCATVIPVAFVPTHLNSVWHISRTESVFSISVLIHLAKF